MVASKSYSVLEPHFKITVSEEPAAEVAQRWQRIEEEAWVPRRRLFPVHADDEELAGILMQTMYLSISRAFLLDDFDRIDEGRVRRFGTIHVPMTFYPTFERRTVESSPLISRFALFMSIDEMPLLPYGNAHRLTDPFHLSLPRESDETWWDRDAFIRLMLFGTPSPFQTHVPRRRSDVRTFFQQRLPPRIRLFDHSRRRRSVQ